MAPPLHDDDKHAKLLRSRLRRLTTSTSLRRAVLGSLAFLLLWRVVLPSLRPARPYTLAEIEAAKDRETRRWGDYIGAGRGREKLEADTPRDYVDLSPPPRADADGAAPFRGRAQPAPDAAGEAAAQLVAVPPALARGVKLPDAQRRGVLGGENWEWSSGIAGLGEWLGPLDMRKDAPTTTSSEERDALFEHYRTNAWTYATAKEEEDARLNLADAQGKPEEMAKLPTRDRVGTDERARDEAARLWSRIYGATERWADKSALELMVERLVRREPLVVFSKTTCPYSMRAKALLSSLSLQPPPYVVEVDLRPNVKALLGRLTSHSTWPNVIIGGKSIGGSDDLAQLHADGALVPLLAQVGVKSR